MTGAPTTNEAAVEPGTAWAPPLDLTEPGVRRFDATRVSRAVKTAREAGWQAGIQSAREEGERILGIVEADARTRAETLLATIQRAADSLSQVESQAAEHFAEQVIDTALELAEAIVARELHEPTTRAAEAARRALTTLDRADGVDLQMHPHDAELLHGLDFPEGVRVIPNPSMQPGDAIALTDDGSVDARISAAIARARVALEGTT